MTFAHGLGAALAAPEPTQQVNDFLRRVLMTEAPAWESDEQRLVRGVSERVDAVSGDASRLLDLARDVHHLLEDASSNEGIRLLLELIAERERVLGVLRKYVQGTITRTGFLSFVAEQHWPEIVRRRVAALSAADVASLVRALEEADIAQLEALLVA
jgi:hypothetical protein